METTYHVHITPQAQQQLKEISDYISTELKSKETALRLLSIFETAISSLSMFPKRIPLTEEEPRHSKGIHFVDLFLL